MSGPLAGCRVVEMAGLGPGPFAAMMLADLGADVTRVERAGTRSPTADKYAMHRGRRSLSVDLKRPEGVEIVMRLLDSSDVFIEGFRPGVMERLGLGPAQCHARNPKLIYGRMTGWGQDGPLAQTAGHDIDYIGVSGILSCVARAGERPVPPVNFLGDFAGGGMLLALGIVSAMWEANRSGLGQVIDAAMVDGSALLATWLYGAMAQGRWVDEAGVNFSDTGSNYYDTYTCADGRFVAVGAVEGQFYSELVERLGLESAGLPDRAVAGNWPELKRRFAEVFVTKTRDEWGVVFDGSDACVAPVLTLTEAPHHPHNVARSVFVERGGVVQPGPAPRFDRTPLELDRLPPMPGQDSIEVLADLGYDASVIEVFVAAGIVDSGGSR